MEQDRFFRIVVGNRFRHPEDHKIPELRFRKGVGESIDKNPIVDPECVEHRRARNIIGHQKYPGDKEEAHKAAS